MGRVQTWLHIVAVGLFVSSGISAILLVVSLTSWAPVSPQSVEAPGYHAGMCFGFVALGIVALAGRRALDLAEKLVQVLETELADEQ